MPRMRILSASEQTAFDKPPQFDYRERKKFFAFPKSILDIAKQLRSRVYQVAFLVSCGYFRATWRFFSPVDFDAFDIRYVAHQLGYDDVTSINNYPNRTRQRHQQRILEFYGFQAFNGQTESSLAIEIDTMARTYLKPRLIFERCLDFLIQQRIQIPKAGTLYELIRSGLQSRKLELVKLMDKNLAPAMKSLLDGLFTAPEEQNSYRLTLLKKLSQSSKPKRIKEGIKDYETLRGLYEQLNDILSALNVGVAGIQYYAGSVLKSEVFQIKRREANDRYIHAVAFVAHQFFRTQDNLVDLWLNVMPSFRTKVIRQHKETLLDNRKKQQQKLRAVVDELDTSVLGLIRDIRIVTDEDELSDTEKIDKIRAILALEQTSAFDDLKADLKADEKDSSWFEVLESGSLKLQNRLSPILRALTFEPNDQATQLLAAIAHFKNHDGKIGESAPIDFLELDEQKALTREDGTFRPSLYKVFLFQHVTSALKSGELNLASSYKYRPIDSYLISPERWNQEKDALLQRAGLTEFADPEPVLDSLNEALLRQYQCTNKNADANQHLKFRADGKFHVSTPALDDNEVETFEEWFPQRHDVPLAQVLGTINNHCGMLKAFAHWQQTYIPYSASYPVLLAGIMGLGCGIGVRKMAQISSHVTETELDHAVNWRFSLDNIRAANDIVVKAMDEMELPNLYRRDPGQLHTASDGQKFEVRGESLHSSRSFKYFGQGQGVSAYTFIDERHFLWHSLVISAADRESAYVIDGLMHNDVVKSNIHSTDTHGYTEAVFGLTHLLGFSFAPRIKNLGKQSIYIFKPKNQAHDDWSIQPDRSINDALIRENWNDLLRLVATIKLKENTASDIFRRLNSYSRQHALYQALKAFGQTIKSLFILRYIDELELRQAIEQQLNKVELANKFTRAVAVGSPREFTQVEKEEQTIAEACNRLIKNSIICWNYLYLSRRLEENANTETKDKLRRAIATHSPISWAHINMLGEYDFSAEKLKDSLGILPLKSAA